MHEFVVYVSAAECPSVLAVQRCAVQVQFVAEEAMRAVV